MCIAMKKWFNRRIFWGTQVVESLHRLYDHGFEHNGTCKKFILTEIRGDWKFQQEPGSFTKNALFKPYPVFLDLICVLILSQEWLHLKNYYGCNLICHECLAHKATYMQPSIQGQRHDIDSFFRESIKAGPPSP